MTRPFTVDPSEYPFADRWWPYRDGVIHYVDNSRVHPGELHASDAGRQQAVRVHPDPESGAGGRTVYDLLDCGLESSPLSCRQKSRIVRNELQQFVDRDDVPEGRVDGVELGRLTVIGEPVWQHTF